MECIYIEGAGRHPGGCHTERLKVHTSGNILESVGMLLHHFLDLSKVLLHCCCIVLHCLRVKASALGDLENVLGPE